MKKVALVTGATSGIGHAIASRLISEGYRVFGTGRRSRENIPVPLLPYGLEYLQMDITNPDSIESTVLEVIAEAGRIDILIACAGMGIAGSVEETTFALASHQINVNFLGTAQTIKTCLPHMRNQSFGRIIIIGSLAGRIGMPYQAYYSSSKFALEGFTEALRYEVKPFGIDVCIVEPGDFRTGFTDSRQKIFGTTPAYATRAKIVLEKQEKDEKNGDNPEKVAILVVRLLAKRKLPIRASVGPMVQRLGAWLKRIIPAKLFEKIYTIYYSIR